MKARHQVSDLRRMDRVWRSRTTGCPLTNKGANIVQRMRIAAVIALTLWCKYFRLQADGLSGLRCLILSTHSLSHSTGHSHVCLHTDPCRRRACTGPRVYCRLCGWWGNGRQRFSYPAIWRLLRGLLRRVSATLLRRAIRSLVRNNIHGAARTQRVTPRDPVAASPQRRVRVRPVIPLIGRSL
jgi:hypothetical protein